MAKYLNKMKKQHPISARRIALLSRFLALQSTDAVTARAWNMGLSPVDHDSQARNLIAEVDVLNRIAILVNVRK